MPITKKAKLTSLWPRRLVGWMEASEATLAPRAADFGGEEGGATVVEFAIVAAPFFFLLFVIAETAMVFIAEQVMDNAVYDTARRIRTGQVQLENLSQEDFKDEVCARMSVFVDCSGGDFYLDVKTYCTFAEMDFAPPVGDEDAFQEESAYEFGGPGDIVVVRAYYQWPTSKVMGGLSLQNMDNGKRLIGSFAAFQNEPFPTITPECA